MKPWHPVEADYLSRTPAPPTALERTIRRIVHWVKQNILH